MLTKRRNGQASRTSLQAHDGRRRSGARRPADLPAPLRPRPSAAWPRSARFQLGTVQKAAAISPPQPGRADRAQEEHLHPLLGRLHGDRRGPERRLDRAGAVLGQPVQPRHALRQGRQRARARAQRPPAEVPDEARRRPVGAHLLGGGDRGDRRQAPRDPRELGAGRPSTGWARPSSPTRAPTSSASSRRLWGTNNEDHQARICHSTTVAGVANTWGYGAMTNSYNDIRNCQDDAGPSAATRPRRTRSRCSTCSRARS